MPIPKKRASQTRKPPQPKRQSKPAPAPVAETQLAEGATALLDTDETTVPAPAVEAVEPVTPTGDADQSEPAQEATTEEAATETETSTSDAQAQEPAVDTVDTPEPSPSAANAVRLGHVEGVLHRVPISALQSILETFEERTAVLRGSAQVLALQARVRETEGRCAPIFLSTTGPGDLPHLLAGLESYAAALNVELTSVWVIVVAADDAGAVQSYLAHRANQKDPSDQSEDDLIRHVLAYHD